MRAVLAKNTMYGKNVETGTCCFESIVLQCRDTLGHNIFHRERDGRRKCDGGRGGGGSMHWKIFMFDFFSLSLSKENLAGF